MKERMLLLCHLGMMQSTTSHPYRWHWQWPWLSRCACPTTRAAEKTIEGLREVSRC